MTEKTQGVRTHLLALRDEARPLSAVGALCGDPERGPLDLNFCGGEITCPECCEIRDACRAGGITTSEYAALVDRS